MSVKILVIEDQQSVRENIEELLEIKGFEVVSASNAVDGLIKIETFIPDLVITDLMLPDFSGIEFIEKLRLIDGYSEIPVIIITGNDKPETFRSSMTRGADDYLSKPFKAQELYDSISSQLHKKEIRKENIELIAELSQQSPLPIIRINQFGKLIYSNPAANEIQCENFIEKIFERIISHDATHFNFEFLYEHQLFKVVVTHNNVQGYYNIYFLDITEEKNKNIELSQKNELILLKNDNLIQFAYIVSHDLKAPIINLRQLTNLIKSEAVDKIGVTSSGEPLLALFEQSLAKIENVMNDLQKILNARDDKSLSVSEVFSIRNQIEKIADLFKNDQNIKHEALFIDIDQKYKLYFPISSFNTLLKNILEDSLRYNENQNSLKIEFKYTESEDDQILEMINHCSSNSRKPAQLNSSILYNPSVESNTEKGLAFQIIKNIMNSHEGDFQLHKRNGKCFSYKLIFKKP
jgi:DNA-binding response OmpR family regulator